MNRRKGELSQPRLHCNRVCIPGALGCGLAIIPDPDAKVSRRWERRIEGYVQRDRRIGKEAVKKAKPIVLAELARKGGLSRWAGGSQEQRFAIGKFLAAATSRMMMIKAASSPG